MFPWGTLIVNMVSSLLVGLLAGLPASPGVTALINSRFCGALSMYSTFGDEIRLWRALRDRPCARRVCEGCRRPRAMIAAV